MTMIFNQTSHGLFAVSEAEFLSWVKCVRRAEGVDWTDTARDRVHIKRPRNSFIIFRCALQHCTADQVFQVPGSFSKFASEVWGALPKDGLVRKTCQEMAAAESKQHAVDNPEYKFRPRNQIYKKAARKKAARLFLNATSSRNLQPSEFDIGMTGLPSAGASAFGDALVPATAPIDPFSLPPLPPPPPSSSSSPSFPSPSPSPSPSPPVIDLGSLRGGDEGEIDVYPS
ncbi:hypothetical protein EXIGLDRAFT_782877 [Exidia glandulosa HHB12029]|uniref:HMG box domain-containing protein n=1 Tax=Exidia glandulosa HHB12029 TaxID=1314781 RepID=A0A165Z3K8_EXIGL|nr:hypothetical protein EXIGLDRAFT_782877 [Exidia glandulosa HHB12029]